MKAIDDFVVCAGVMGVLSIFGRGFLLPASIVVVLCAIGRAQPSWLVST
jgi:hypothetical protein